MTGGGWRHLYHADDHDGYWTRMASVAAIASSCDRAEVGAVLVSEFRTGSGERVTEEVAKGWNGAPDGLATCEEIGHLVVENHCKRAMHAERRAMLQLDGRRNGGLVLYATHFPCPTCAADLIYVGVHRVVYREEWPDGEYSSAARRLLEEAGVELTKWTR